MKISIIQKYGPTLFLRLALVALGILVLVLCIFVIPLIAGGLVVELPRVAFMQVPFLVAVYGAAMTFYVAVFYSFKLLRCIEKGAAFSSYSVSALKNITGCAIAISIFFATILPIFFELAQADDAPGAFLIGLMIFGFPVVIAVIAATLRKLVQHAIDIKSENELTV